MIGYLTSILFPAVEAIIAPTEQGMVMPVGLNDGPDDPKHGPRIWTIYGTTRAALVEKNTPQGK